MTTNPESFVVQGEAAESDEDEVDDSSGKTLKLTWWFSNKNFFRAPSITNMVWQ